MSTEIMKIAKFEEMGKELLRHKYRYYVLARPTISDYEYDMLEWEYALAAKKLVEKPKISLIADWDFLEWQSCASLVGYPADHPWAKEIESEFSNI